LDVRCLGLDHGEVGLWPAEEEPDAEMSNHTGLVPLLLALLHPLGGQPVEWSAQDATSEDANSEEKGFQWRPALEQSGLYLAIQHASRMAQAKSRRELGGPFWKDYFESVSTIHTWNDGDSIVTNYVGHPVMGAVAGYIQIVNDPRGRRLEFDASSKRYWQSRLKAMAWSAAYSTEFELGPISEASIGNVGKHPPTMAVADLVVTPAGGFTLILLEDYLDKRFISRWERGTSRTKARVYRVALNPGRSLANLLRFKHPSYRDNRPL